MSLQAEQVIFALLVLITVLIVVVILSYSIRIIPEYQRAVKFRLGRAVGVVGPGVVFVIPLIENIIKYDLRVEVVDVPAQRALTRDNVEVTIDAAVYLRVMDALKTALTVKNHIPAVSIFAASTLRDVVGMVDLDTLLAHREEIAKRIAAIVDEHVTPWGVKVTAVAIKDIKLPDILLRAMASQAEAERVRRAKITLASAEYEASKIYLEAAQRYAQNSVAVQLRMIDALIEIARERNLVIITPPTLEFVALPAALARQRGQEGGAEGGGGGKGGKAGA
jgi:regulator of protease activity HflC (stomatin/prohibitin superfamily)